MPDVTLSGPWFDARGGEAIHEYLDWAQLEVGKQALADVMGNLNASIRHPTPYYETQINIARDDPDLVVNDRGVIYGPWLEGTGSRNTPVTAFPGYHSFSRAADSVEARVPGLIDPIPPEFTDAMNA